MHIAKKNFKKFESILIFFSVNWEIHSYGVQFYNMYKKSNFYHIIVSSAIMLALQFHGCLLSKMPWMSNVPGAILSQFAFCTLILWTNDVSEAVQGTTWRAGSYQDHFWRQPFPTDFWIYRPYQFCHLPIYWQVSLFLSDRHTVNSVFTGKLCKSGDHTSTNSFSQCPW